ncbi:MAG: hypothetical protein KGL67_01490 [Patescibacteria group bacterium]|nr:hypothetical protein [Patescibacteria group bacterium]
MDRETKSREFLHTLIYILKPKDEDHWQVFKEEFRPSFQQQFLEEWGNLLNTNRLVAHKEVVCWLREDGNVSLDH